MSAVVIEAEAATTRPEKARAMVAMSHTIRAVEPHRVWTLASPAHAVSQLRVLGSGGSDPADTDHGSPFVPFVSLAHSVSGSIVLGGWAGGRRGRGALPAAREAPVRTVRLVSRWQRLSAPPTAHVSSAPACSVELA